MKRIFIIVLFLSASSAFSNLLYGQYRLEVDIDMDFHHPTYSCGQSSCNKNAKNIKIVVNGKTLFDNDPNGQYEYFFDLSYNPTSTSVTIKYEDNSTCTVDGSITSFCSQTSSDGNASCGIPTIEDQGYTLNKWKTVAAPNITTLNSICQGNSPDTSTTVEVPSDVVDGLVGEAVWVGGLTGNSVEIGITTLESALKRDLKAGDRVYLSYRDSGCSGVSSRSTPLDINGYAPGVNLNNVTVQKPTCNGDEDAAITIPSIDADGSYGFTMSYLHLKSGDCNGENPFTINAYNPDSNQFEAIEVCNPTEAYNFDTTKTATEWNDNGIVLDKNIDPDNAGVSELLLGAGVWEIQIEPNGEEKCFAKFYVLVDEPDPVMVNTDSESTTDNICPGTSDGIIELSAEGGSETGYEYKITGKSYQSETSFSGLEAKTYDLYARDDNNCTSESVKHTIGTWKAVNLNTVKVVTNYGGYDVSCQGASDASVQASASEGFGNYDYTYSNEEDNSVSGSNNNNTGDVTFSGLKPGPYTIEVSDDNGCIDTKGVTIDNADPFNASLNATKDVSCYGKADGEIKLQLENQVGTVSYVLNEVNEPPDDITNPSYPIFYIGNGTYTFDRIYYTIDGKTCNAKLTGLSGIDINEPSQLSISRKSYTEPTCPGSSDGEIVIEGNGGSNTNYDIKLGDTWVSNVSSAQFTGLMTGDHSVEIREADNTTCNRTGLSVTLPSKDPIDATINLNPPSCAGYSDGSIEVTGEGGDPPYTFAINNGNFTSPANSHTFTGLSGNQEYDIIISDSNYDESDSDLKLCQKIITITLPDAAPVDATFDINHVSCYGNTDAGIITSPTGGTGSFAFAWSVAGKADTISTSKDLTGVGNGKYDLVIEDTNGCTAYFSELQVTQPDSLKLDSINTSVETCQGRDDGTAEIFVSGGTTPYAYSIDGGTFTQDQPLHTNLSSGNHTVTVRDANGCTADSAFTIGLNEISVSVFEQQDPLCYGDATGFINLDPASGGVAPYQYSIDNGATYQTNTGFDDIPAQAYNVIAKDNSGCESVVLTTSLSDPPELTATLNKIQDEACGQQDGQVAIDITGGVGSYDTLWQDNNLQQVNPMQLEGGTYTVQVTDTNACVWQETFDIQNIPAPALSYSVIDSSYCGQAIGSANVGATGGFAPYNYLWDDPQQQTDATATDLEAGTYRVEVTDTRNCRSTINVQMRDGQPMYLADKTTEITGCAVPEGSISVTIDGGVGPYTYDWPDSVTTESVNAIDSLYAGVYPLQVTDDVNCTLDLLPEVASTNQPEIDTVIVTPSYCDLPTGALYAEVSEGTGNLSSRWMSPTTEYPMLEVDSVLAGDYLFEVVDDEGCKAFRQVTVEDDVAVEPALSLAAYDSSACGQAIGTLEVLMEGGDMPYAFQWDDPAQQQSSIATALSAGTYQVVATDDKGCVENLEVTMVDKADPELNLTAITHSECAKPIGKATVAVSNGVTPYSYYWDDDQNQRTAQATRLLPGDYNVFALDSNGCSTDTLTIPIQDDFSLDVSLQDMGVVSCYDSTDGFAEVAVTGNRAPFTYSWDDARNQTTTKATNLGQGTYTVTVTDSINCQVELEVEIPQPAPLQISRMATTDLRCYNLCEGRVTATATGGNYPYAFEVANEQNTFGLDSLCPDAYTLQLQDSKGCWADSAFTINNAEKLDIGLQESVKICRGTVYTADAGDWESYEWSSAQAQGVIGRDQTIDLSETGTYYVEAITNRGCVLPDTLDLEVRDDLMEADFLIDTEVLMGDTVELIDISWPLPQSLQWEVPNSVEVVEEKADRLVLMFPYEGAYDIGLDAYNGACHDYWNNTIKVLNPADSQSTTNGRLGYTEGIKKYNLYPNPNSGTFTVSIELSEASPVALELLDMQYGETILTKVSPEAREHNVSIRQNLPNGLYYLKIESMNEQKVIKFLVVR